MLSWLSFFQSKQQATLILEFKVNHNRVSYELLLNDNQIADGTDIPLLEADRSLGTTLFNLISERYSQYDFTCVQVQSSIRVGKMSSSGGFMDMNSTSSEAKLTRLRREIDNNMEFCFKNAVNSEEHEQRTHLSEPALTPEMVERERTKLIVEVNQAIIARLPDITYANLLLAFHPDKSSTLAEAFQKLGVTNQHARDREQFIFTETIMNSEQIFKDISKTLIKYAQENKDKLKSPTFRI